MHHCGTVWRTALRDRLAAWQQPGRPGKGEAAHSCSADQQDWREGGEWNQRHEIWWAGGGWYAYPGLKSTVRKAHLFFHCLPTKSNKQEEENWHQLGPAKISLYGTRLCTDRRKVPHPAPSPVWCPLHLPPRNPTRLRGGRLKASGNWKWEKSKLKSEKKNSNLQQSWLQKSQAK